MKANEKVDGIKELEKRRRKAGGGFYSQHASRQGGNQPLYTKEEWEARRKARRERNEAAEA